MPRWAIAVRGAEDALRLVWKLQRNAMGDVSLVDYATPRTGAAGGFPGITWRGDGYFHLSAPEGTRVVRQRQPLQELRGCERAYQGPLMPALAPGLPACVPHLFDAVYEMPEKVLENPEYRELHLDLMWPGAEVPGHDGPLERFPLWLLTDATPWIAVSVHEVEPDIA